MNKRTEKIVLKPVSIFDLPKIVKEIEERFKNKEEVKDGPKN